jgi:L-ascorbate metabolism protein UlaG (beta-lactamase superfamily)
MEITWLGETCVRLKGREGIVAVDAYRSVVGKTGHQLTADVATFSHAEDEATLFKGVGGKASDAHGVILPTSLEPAFPLDAPGEYEVHGILVNGVRTFRDDARGGERGLNVAFVVELDGIHIVHLGDTGHALTEEQIGEIGTVHVACIPVGGALSPTKAVEIATALDAPIVVPLPIGDDADGALARFLKEMSVTEARPEPKLTVSISTVPEETRVIVLEAKPRT